MNPRNFPRVEWRPAWVGLVLRIGITAALFAAASPSPAQSNAEGYVFGRVSSGGAVLTAINLDTGLRRETRADARGEFRLGALPVGRYRVALEPAGPSDSSVVIDVNVGSGTRLDLGVRPPAAPEKIVLEKFAVAAAATPPIDTSTTETATVFRAETIGQLPVERNLSAVALLAPGTTRGVAAFPGLVSFGGSSVAENRYFVNGFDLTSFRDGLSYAEVPFEFYDNFQVKTGGYSAEFGRATGGVQNSSTKRGGNSWESGTNAFWSPAEFSAHPTNRPFNRGWSFNANAHAGGPLIRDRLFVYGLYNARRSFTESASTVGLSRSTAKDPFWGAKLDWHLTDRHVLELTAFSDRGKTAVESFAYQYATQTILASRGVTDQLRGGETLVARYTGALTERFTLSLLAGRGGLRFTNRGAGDDFPYILDQRGGPSVQLGRATSPRPGVSQDRRTATRADGEYVLGAHRLRFGVDRDDTTVFNLTRSSGGVFWRYSTTVRANQTLSNGAVVPTAGTAIARKNVFVSGGDFRTLNGAFYAEDNWRVLDGRLLLNLGLRRDDFDNRNVKGETFLKSTGRLGPRAGLSFDVAKDGRSKIFANCGRYYLPVPAFANVVLAGALLQTEEYYALNGLGPDSLPILGPQLGTRHTINDGTVHDPREIVDHHLKAMHQDEVILGYQRMLGRRWAVGVRGIYRTLRDAQEDIYIDAAVTDYARALGLRSFSASGFDYGVLANPGRPLTVAVDLGDGRGARDVTFTPAQLQYPRARRQYGAAEIFFERLHDGRWFLQGSYTLSHSYGNSEGWTRSDDGSAGVISSNFDQIGLTDGAYGDLPNDHRHKFKAFGAYQLTRGISAGANLQVTSGMPVSAFGFHPTDESANGYGAASFYDNGRPVPRGSRGRTPWVTACDLSLHYHPAWRGRAVPTFGLDVFNVFNRQSATELDQVAETAAGVRSPTYRSPLQYQAPRAVRCSVDLKF